MEANQNSKMEASFSTLVLSLGSSAAMALGVAPDPSSGQTQVNKPMARFNIDLLVMLQEKTKSNLNQEEEEFLSRMINDLQMKYVHLSK